MMTRYNEMVAERTNTRGVSQRRNPFDCRRQIGVEAICQWI
jgi:hypothetical protein